MVAHKRWLTVGVMAVCGAAAAQPFPHKPIRLLVPLSAGSAIDVLGRAVGQKLLERWGQQIVVDNRPSAGGVIASELLLNATPDGHTLMMVSIGHAVNASLFSKLPYDTVKDFAGVTLIADIPNVLVAAPALGVKSVKELIELARAKPGQVNYASAGVGSGTHMNGEEFKLAAGINVVHVPFKLLSDVFTEMVAGRVHLYMFPLPAVMPMLKDGKLTVLAVGSLQRVPSLPGIQTIAESGLPGFQSLSWFGVVAPAKTGRPIVQQLNRDIAGLLQQADTRERFLRQGADATPGTPEEFARFIKADYDRIAKLARVAGLKVD